MSWKFADRPNDMEKTTKRRLLIALSLTAIVIVVLTWSIYFATQISATFPHLKDYQYSMTAKQLEADIIKTLNSDSCFCYTLTDSTGIMEGRNYYMTIEQKFNDDSLIYLITYSDNDKSGCSLGLVGVFDKTNKSGGYLDQDRGVERLIGIFDQQLIGRINVGGY